MISIDICSTKLCRYGEVLTSDERDHRTVWWKRCMVLENLGFEINIRDTTDDDFIRTHFINFETEEEAALFRLTHL